MTDKVQLFSKRGAVAATVEVETGAEAVRVFGVLYVLKDGVYRETDVGAVIAIYEFSE